MSLQSLPIKQGQTAEHVYYEERKYINLKGGE